MRIRFLAVVLVAVLVSMVVQLSGVSPARAAGPCGPPVVNPVACENSQPGAPASQWDVSGAGSSTIQGFATDISVNAGQTVTSRSRRRARSYRLDIYRLGYYQGTGRPTDRGPHADRDAAADATGLPDERHDRAVDCGNWAVSASWAVPPTAVSGIYFARSTARTARPAPATSSSSCATTPATPTCSSRPPTPPGRPTTTTAATASTSAAPPAGPTR